VCDGALWLSLLHGISFWAPALRLRTCVLQPARHVGCPQALAALPAMRSFASCTAWGEGGMAACTSFCAQLTELRLHLHLHQRDTPRIVEFLLGPWSAEVSRCHRQPARQHRCGLPTFLPCLRRRPSPRQHHMPGPPTQRPRPSQQHHAPGRLPRRPSARAAICVVINGRWPFPPALLHQRALAHP